MSGNTQEKDSVLEKRLPPCFYEQEEVCSEVTE